MVGQKQKNVLLAHHMHQRTLHVEVGVLQGFEPRMLQRGLADVGKAHEVLLIVVAPSCNYRVVVLKPNSPNEVGQKFCGHVSVVDHSHRIPHFAVFEPAPHSI